MYKAVYIDDETWIIKSIQHDIDWKAAGFELISAMNSSVDALKFILSEKPDIVFTDIRMPVISGIDLMNQVREAGLYTEFVVVSGYGEFSYAQQALKLGAFDYCLKPIQPEYIQEILKRLYKILEDRDNSSYSIFEAIMEEKSNTCEIIKKSGMKCEKRYFQAVTVRYKNRETVSEIVEFLKTMDYIKINQGSNKMFFIINSDDDIGVLLRNAVLAESGYSIGLSRLSAKAGEIAELLTEADISSDGYFIYGLNQRICYTGKNVREINKFLEELLCLIDRKLTKDIKIHLKGIPGLFRLNEMNVDNLSFLWNHMVAYMTNKFPGSETTLEFMDYNKLTSAFYDIEDFSTSLANYILYFFENAEDVDENDYTLNLNFNKLLKYVQENYDRQLFLKDISKQFFINQNYCSILFKKHIGYTFTDYLNILRMEKAKSMLEGAEVSIEKIAGSTGFNDYFYFIKVFKKYFGNTPSKYRKNFLDSERKLNRRNNVLEEFRTGGK